MYKVSHRKWPPFPTVFLYYFNSQYVFWYQFSQQYQTETKSAHSTLINENYMYICQSVLMLFLKFWPLIPIVAVEIMTKHCCGHTFVGHPVSCTDTVQYTMTIFNIQCVNKAFDNVIYIRNSLWWDYSIRVWWKQDDNWVAQLCRG